MQFDYDHELPDLERLMLTWAREAGELAMKYYRRTGDLEFKEAREAITVADGEIELLLRDRIAHSFPDDCVVGEEYGGLPAAEDGDGRTWFIDPIDGTLNFAVGLPVFCTSLAVMRGPEILAACVYQPTTGDAFTASLGQGFRRNGMPVRVSDRGRLADAIVSTQLKGDGRYLENPVLLQEMLSAPLKTRRVGAIALELAWLAVGGYDALVAGFRGPIQLVDIAAGLLLVTEAGGKITDHRGAPYRPGGADLIATNGEIHQEVLELIAGEE